MAKNNVNTKDTTKKGGIVNFFKGVKQEIAKNINWPPLKDTKKALIAVAIFVLIYVVLIGGFDFIFQKLFQLISKLK